MVGFKLSFKYLFSATRASIFASDAKLTMTQGCFEVGLTLAKSLILELDEVEKILKIMIFTASTSVSLDYIPDTC